MNNHILYDYCDKTKRRSLYKKCDYSIGKYAFTRIHSLMEKEKEESDIKYVKLYYNNDRNQYRFSTYSYFIGIKVKKPDRIKLSYSVSIGGYKETLYNKSSKPYFKLEDYYEKKYCYDDYED